MITTSDDVFFTFMLQGNEDKGRFVVVFFSLNVIKNPSPQVLKCMNWQVVRNNNRCLKSTKNEEAVTHIY